MSIENNEKPVNDSKLCKNCGKIMKGRTDKKFCHEFCRNSYHNRHKERTSLCERIINKSLHRNRSILRALFDPSKVVTRVDKRELLRQGFHFRYMTHVLTSDKGTQYTFCYEFGYADMGKEGVWLVGDPFTNH